MQSVQTGDYTELHGAIVSNIGIMEILLSFCYFGNRITMKAQDVGFEAYDADWYNYPPKIQLLLLPIVQQSQKEFIFTGYHLVECSMESFKEVKTLVKQSQSQHIVFHLFLQLFRWWISWQLRPYFSLEWKIKHRNQQE